MFKSRRKKKVNLFKEKLIENKFSDDEVKSLIPIYNRILKLSNIFLANILMVVTSILVLIIAATLKTKEIQNAKKLLFWIFGILITILTIIQFVVSILLFIKVLVKSFSIKEMRNKVFIWAILSIIPVLSFIAFFIMKWKISNIYKYRKN
ncbi:MAG: hypothetical protein IKJ03_00265 [Mycoplasmataceae bacterium]|nr:hypothetical protein [Mycoplasmataceae bacterium]